MLSDDVIQEIQEGKIRSRRELFSRLNWRGRRKPLRDWLDAHDLLRPTKWTKENIDTELKRLYKNGASLTSQDNPNIVHPAQRYYGTWNNALSSVLGFVNQHRYTKEHLLNSLYMFIEKYKRLPLREEFNGSVYERPDWSAYIFQFGLKRWSDVFGIIDTTKLKFFFNKKHGYGSVILFDGKIFLSRQEYLIAKYFVENNISYEKEVPYGNSKHIFDFYLPTKDVYIEYYGMGTKEYKTRIEEKRSFYANRRVIEIFKHDNTIKKLSLEVQRL